MTFLHPTTHKEFIWQTVKDKQSKQPVAHIKGKTFKLMQVSYPVQSVTYKQNLPNHMFCHLKR